MTQYKFCPRCGRHLLHDGFCDYCQKSFGKKPFNWKILWYILGFLVMIFGTVFTFKIYLQDQRNLLWTWLFVVINIFDWSGIYYCTWNFDEMIPQKRGLYKNIFTLLCLILFSTACFLIYIWVMYNVIVINGAFHICLVIELFIETVMCACIAEYQY